jgi:hypothetical protein
LIWLLTEWSGINALLYYGPTLVEAIGIGSHLSTPQPRDGSISDTTNLMIAGGIGIVQVIAVLPAIWAIDRVGSSFLLSDLAFTHT